MWTHTPACINKHSEPKLKNEINNTRSLMKTTLERNLSTPDIQLLIMNIRKLVWNQILRWAEIIPQIPESKFNLHILTNLSFLLDNHLFLTQEKRKRKLWIENMENIWVVAILQLELELQLHTKKQIIEIIPLVDTVEVEKHVALINLLDIHTLKLCFQATKKTFNKSLRTLSCSKTVRLLT